MLRSPTCLPAPAPLNLSSHAHLRGNGRAFTFRRRRAGCASWLLVIGLVVGVSSLRLEAWLRSRRDRAGAVSPRGLAGPGTRCLQPGRPGWPRGGAAFQRLASDAADTDALRLLTRALIYRSFEGEYDRAIDRQMAMQFGARAVARAPSNPEMSRMYAYALAVNGQPADAADTARRALEAARTRSTPASRCRARLWRSRDRRGRPARSRARHECRDPGKTRWMHLVAGRDRLRVTSAAMTKQPGWPTRAISLNGRLLSLHFERALYALQTGGSGWRNPTFSQVLALDETNVKAHMRLCELSSLLRESDAAVRYCGRVTSCAVMGRWLVPPRPGVFARKFGARRIRCINARGCRWRQNVPPAERRFECWYLQGQASRNRRAIAQRW